MKVNGFSAISTRYHVVVLSKMYKIKIENHKVEGDFGSRLAHPLVQIFISLFQAMAFQLLLENLQWWSFHDSIKQAILLDYNVYGNLFSFVTKD